MLSVNGLIIVVFGLVVLLLYLPGALLCVWPGFMRVREDEDDGPSRVPDALGPVADELGRLGFRRLGVRVEGPPMRPGARTYEYALESENTFANLGFDDEPMLTLETPFDDGSFVVTTDFRRPGVERKARYLAGGIPGATPQQLLTVHRRRVEELRGTGKAPKADLTLKGAVAARRLLLRGVGAREIRTANATRLMVALVALMAVISVLFGQPLGPGVSAVDATRLGAP
jgi:hypothetical protein